jgi:hypothetical protein
MSHFPVKSGKSDGFAACRGLTGGLPDVRTGELLQRGLIRQLNRGPCWRETAFTVPSLRCQCVIGLTLPRKYQGIDPDGAFETPGEARRNPSQSIRWETVGWLSGHLFLARPDGGGGRSRRGAISPW